MAKGKSSTATETAHTPKSPHRALFYDEEENRMEKFRPYGLPSKEWLAWVGEQLRKA